MKQLKQVLMSISAVVGLATPALASNQFPIPSTEDSSMALVQSPADLERQREAERQLQEAEKVRRENSTNDYAAPVERNLEQRTNDAVDRLRNNFGNEQKRRESQVEIERLRRERIRLDRYYDWERYRNPIFSPYDNPPGYGNFGNFEIAPSYSNDEQSDISSPEILPVESTSQLNSRLATPAKTEMGTASLSIGFKDGAAHPAVGYRFAHSPVAIEVGTVLNQDRLPPGQVNDFSVPDSLLQQFPNGFNDLGQKTVTPQIGADILGYFDVSPTVSLYGGVGLYFQGRSIIFQSKATTDLYKQASSTNTNVAFSGGADLRLNDSWHLGGGYHSLRGITAKISYDF